MTQRFYSLDVFRGATVALMILVNNPGSWKHIYAPLEHAPWHGCTPTDLVFPFFLFAVGNSLSFVMPRLEQAGTAATLRKIFKRTLLIFIIGLLLNWVPFVKWDGNLLLAKPWSTLRIMGVLQRIALCYCLASLAIFFFKSRGAFVFAAVLLLGYWVVCLLLGNPADPYSLEGFWGTYFDRSVLGINHMYKGEGVPFDPEGLASTIPAIAQVIFGFLVGQYIREKSAPDPNGPLAPSPANANFQMLSHLFVIGCIMIFAGLCWNMVFPMNKKIWSSSYVLYTTGLATLILAIMIFLIEIKGVKGAWSKFFDAFGKNPLFIFVLSGLLPRLLDLIRIPAGMNEQGLPIYVSPFSWFYQNICAPISSNPKNGSLLYALCMIGFYWLIVYWMDKRKIYVKV